MEYQTLLQFFPESLRELILAKDISDVMINEDGEVYVDRTGEVKPARGVWIKPDQLVMAIQNVARLLRADIDDTQPILDSRLPDGSRVAAIYANGAMNVTIRKFNRWFSTDDLDRTRCFPNSISSVVVNGLLGKDQKEKANVLISGGTGSGKTTLAKALIDRMPMTDRLIVIERPKELSIQHAAALHLEAVDGVPGSVA